MNFEGPAKDYWSTYIVAGSMSISNDPITFTANFTNENNLPVGEYTGIVKVKDSRIPGTVVIGGEPDTFVHVPDGVSFEWFKLNECF